MSRRFWWWMLAAIIAAGLLSRVTRTGFVVVDKYLGDALYAAMVYVLLRLTGRVARVALWACVVMLGLELFQLTGIPAALYEKGNVVIRVCARLLGTEFGFGDLAAYAVGVAAVSAVDRGGKP